MPVRKLIFNAIKENPIENSQPENSIIEKEEAYVVQGATRGTANIHEVVLDKDKCVEFHFDDNTKWICDSNTLDEVFPEAVAAEQRSVDGAFQLPQTLQSSATERGLPDILLKGVTILTKKKVQTGVNEVVRNIAIELEKKQLDNLSGLYKLNNSFELTDLEPGDQSKPYLLFLHGTASSTTGSFGELNTESEESVWQELLSLYTTNILTFQHETLTKSPLQNVAELTEQLPSKATLHMVTHSRGGLVGDVLARFCNSKEKSLRGFDDNEVNYLAENSPHELEYIKRIDAALQEKDITVSKFIRVACPAAGTILASKRLDNFLNISLNLVGLAGGIASPVYTLFKSLITAAIDTKNSNEALPGIEAMKPDSPFIKVLNNPNSSVEIDNPLVVISGNCKIGFQLKALLVIASKLFYLTGNDLVVNTLSMYQGSKRKKNLTYLFDEATNVDHFHYFANEKTGKALLAALDPAGNLPGAGFNTKLQRKLAQGERNAVLNLEGGAVPVPKLTGNRPIVVLLPGIMGSNLSIDDKPIWINYRRFLSGGLRELDITNNNVKASSLVGTSYTKLTNYLSATYDVVLFAFDWRLSLTKTAEEFKNKMVELLNLAKSKNQAIKIIGHSMGGVLVREFMIRHPEVWDTLNKSVGFKLLFLGAPLGGSFRIPAVFFGRDPIIDKLAMIDIFHSKKQLLKIFSTMPGLWSLLPLTTDLNNDFVKNTVWKRMAETVGDGWPLPVNDGQDLEEFKAYRSYIHQKLETIDYTNIAYIAGKDKATPCGYRIDDHNGNRELVFLSTAEGDQSVTWDSGIPAKMIKDQSVYYVNVTHGALANEPSIFEGISDIIAKGFTNLLSRSRPVVRGEEKLFRSPDYQDFDVSEEGIVSTLIGLQPQETITRVTKPLNVSVAKGHLQYAQYPVLVGHFVNDAILNAEAQIDKMLNGQLSQRHPFLYYPGPIGTSEIVIVEDHQSDKRVKGAVVVGLGTFGSLSSPLLTKTIEQGVIHYLQDVNGNSAYKNIVNRKNEQLGISTLVIGSGYGSLSIENSVRAILQGIQNANNIIEKKYDGSYILISNIQFVELFEDKALSCFNSVKRIIKDGNPSLSVTIDNRQITTLLGSQRRIPTESAEDWWYRTRVEKSDKGVKGRVRLNFTASTRGAREEKTTISISSHIIDNIILESSKGNMWAPRVAKILFERLLPIDLKEQFKQQFNIHWILDKDTASYPWELLQEDLNNGLPLCINAGMIRQFADLIDNSKKETVNSSSVLVVGEPILPESYMAPLPAANEEGKKVNEMLSRDNQFQITALLNENGRATAINIINELSLGNFKIVHLAGHGLFDDAQAADIEDDFNAGMVIGKDQYLTTEDIKQLPFVPELAFINCCSLGAINAAAEEFARNTHKYAANIGTAFIRKGAKAVIVAGWAVNDAAALKFTEVFYDRMLDADCFGDAVRKARRAVYEEFHNLSNTWGAYQCYGDPFYKFRDDIGGDRSFSKEFVIPEEAEIELFNLASELKTGRYTYEEISKRLKAISLAVTKAGISSATITEREAMIHADLGEYEVALEKFRSLLTLEKAGFSVLVLEKYCNVLIKDSMKQLLEALSNDKVKSEEEREKLIAEKKNRGLEASIKATAGLQSLLLISPTAERFNLLGTAFKRRGIFCSDQTEKKAAYNKAAEYYAIAYKLQVNNKAYSFTNWLAIESILILADSDTRTWDRTVIAGDNEAYRVPSKEDALKILQRLKNEAGRSTGDLDYWIMVQVPNCQLCQVIIDHEHKGDKEWNEVKDAYFNVWNLAGSKGDKQAEREHLQLLSDACSISSNANSLKARIDELIAKLGKVV